MTSYEETSVNFSLELIEKYKDMLDVSPTDLEEVKKILDEQKRENEERKKLEEENDKKIHK